MPTLHIVDYAGDDQRAGRLVEEVVNRLPEAEFEVGLVSYGDALARFAALAGRLRRPVSLVETPALGYRFAVALDQDAQYRGRVTHEVLADTFAAADLIWFPWVHDHLFDSRHLIKAVASFHDPVPVEMAEFLADKSDPPGSAACTGMAAQADMANRRLMASFAGVAAGSPRIAAWLAETYAPQRRQPVAVPLPTPSLLDEEALPVPGLPPRYMVYTGSIAPAGNHESLLMALSRLKRQGAPVLPLVLAGEGTDRIASGGEHRAAYLKALSAHLKLETGSEVIGLGPLSPGALKTVMAGAAAAVMPALAEGEALSAVGQAAEFGLPLACSDLPAIRDYCARRSLQPAWFKPGAADGIAAALLRLAAAERGTPAPAPDTDWDRVGQSYLTMFREQAILASTQSGGR